jgi:hypothetical protein
MNRSANCCEEEIALPRGLAEVPVLDLGDRLRRVRDTRR